MPPLSLYVHIPWCIRKCPYCDFNSHQAAQEIPQQEYVDALICDLESEAQNAQGRTLGSIFFGGGTPSLFEASAIADIIDAADRLIGITADAEITLEANPGAVEQSRFSGYRAAGVNRLSIGVQSYNDEQLIKLGRVHSSEQAEKASSAVRAAGFDNYNIDLMHGLPGQTPEQALNDIQRAVDNGASHISWYQLTIEANTAFYSQPPQLPDEQTLEEIGDSGQALLQQQGFDQYEVSAWCRRGHRSAHNLNYWQFGDYIGIGAGAHGKISSHCGKEIVRRSKTRMPEHYLRNIDKLASCNAISAEQLPLEFMMNALRLREGVDSSLFSGRTHLDFSVIEHTVKQLIDRGLLDNGSSRLLTTPLGYRFLDSVLENFSTP